TGGLGSPLALYLAAAGVGTIGLIDHDVVDLSNLQRQVIHHTADIGRPKVLSAKDKIQAINPDVGVVTHNERLMAGNALELIRGYDIVLDGVDNFPAKFLITVARNPACPLCGDHPTITDLIDHEPEVCTIRGPG
ncbi:MAG TPA: HesA/MoeB/ThiF family protein, partial [Nitrospira sp.]|nr:HesA/MoeB/ThiF family protein [Nitrospira sp.]